jgi:hypothetical protein
MFSLLASTFKLLAILLAPLAVIGFVISQQVISGNEYVAVLEILGSNTEPGAIEIFGADINTISALLDFFETWSLPLLLALASYGILGLSLSKNKLQTSFRLFLGLFFSFGFWALLLSRTVEIFTNFIGPDISDLSALVIAQFLSELSNGLLNLTGLLALVCGSLALGLWLIGNRRKVRA